MNNGHWNINTDLSGLVPGNVTVVAIATDVTGRTAESVDHALIDITGPRIDITVDSVTLIISSTTQSHASRRR